MFMQTTKLLTGVIISLMGLAACSKSTHIDPPASITIVNALAQLPTGKTIIPVLGTADPIIYFTSAKTIAYGTAGYYSPQQGNNSLYVVKSSDSTNPILRSEFDVTSGSMYSLYISGDTLKPETLFVQDILPSFNDTSAAVRFVNLSPASEPVKINIKANGAAKPEFTSIAYRQSSDFKVYPAGSTASGLKYIFEVRNEATDALLVSYTWTSIRSRCHTLVFAGSVNASGKPTALKVFPVTNY